MSEGESMTEFANRWALETPAYTSKDREKIAWLEHEALFKDGLLESGLWAKHMARGDCPLCATRMLRSS